METETSCRSKQWDRERASQLKQKYEEEETVAWDKMYRIQVKTSYIKIDWRSIYVILSKDVHADRKVEHQKMHEER